MSKRDQNMLIDMKKYTSKYLEIGQTYKIQIVCKDNTSRFIQKKRVKAKLIGQTKYFFVFERQGSLGTIKDTINKLDWHQNPALIQEI